MVENTRFQQYRELNRVMLTASSELKKSPLELECIAYVGGKDKQKTTVSEIFEEFRAHSKSAISTLTSDLVRANLFTKQINPERQKNRIVCLTPKGKVVYGSLMAYFNR